MASSSLSLASLLPLLEPGLHADLAHPAALARAQKLMGQLPFFSSGGFECRLSAQGTAVPQPVDVAVHFTAKSGGFERLAAYEKHFPAPNTAEAKAGWERLRAFAQAHNTPKHKLRTAVPSSWLEFDVPENADAAEVAPNFFFQLDEDYGRPPILGPQAQVRWVASIEMLREALGLLGLDEKHFGRTTLGQTLRHRPGSARLEFVGLMLNRPAPGFRLMFSTFPLSELTAFLNHIHWPGAHEPLWPLLEMLGTHTPHIALNVEIAAQTLSRLSFEVSFDDNADEPGAWANFLDDLIRLGLCAPTQASALQQWPAHLHRPEWRKLWPEGLSREQNYLVRRLNHIKLTYAPPEQAVYDPQRRGGVASLPQQVVSGALSAKAYLAYHLGTLTLREATGQPLR